MTLIFYIIAGMAGGFVACFLLAAVVMGKRRELEGALYEAKCHLQFLHQHGRSDDTPALIALIDSVLAGS